MKADILACYGTTWIDRLITKVTGDPITHIAIAIDSAFCMETGYFGVKLTKIKDKQKHFHVLRCDELTDDERQLIVTYVMESVGTKYDYKLLIGLAINKILGVSVDWNDTSKYICVELALDAYLKIGRCLIPPYLDKFLHPRPNDLMTSPQLKKYKPEEI